MDMGLVGARHEMKAEEMDKVGWSGLYQRAVGWVPPFLSSLPVWHPPTLKGRTWGQERYQRPCPGGLGGLSVPHTPPRQMRYKRETESQR